MIVFVPFYIAAVFVGGLDNSHFMAFFLTDFAEATSYAKVISAKLVALSLLIISPLVYFFRALHIKVNKKIASVTLIAVILYSAGKYYLNYNYYKNSDNLYTFKVMYVSPVRIMVRSYSMMQAVQQELKEQRKLTSVPNTWENVSHFTDEERNYVIIIGESVRRDFMGVYNDGFANTPFLNTVNKIKFNGAISYAHQTYESLGSSLMETDKNGKPYFPNNIVALSQKAGFQVNWISNQGAIGIEDNFLAAMGSQADYYNFVSKGKWNNHVDDSAILEVLGKRIKMENSKPSVYFLHMIGSHPDPCDITEGKYDRFLFSKNISCYVESIKRTDQFIETTYNLLSSRKKPFTIVYFSDHSLYFEDHNVYHRDGFKESYQIPFIVIDSEMKENVQIDKPRNLKDFLVFYAQLLNIKTDNLAQEYQFISNEEAPERVFQLYNNIDYRKLPDNPLPEKYKRIYND